MSENFPEISSNWVRMTVEYKNNLYASAKIDKWSNGLRILIQKCLFQNMWWVTCLHKILKLVEGIKPSTSCHKWSILSPSSTSFYENLIIENMNTTGKK